MLQAIGAGHDGLQALAVPLLRNGSVVYVIYAFNGFFARRWQTVKIVKALALVDATAIHRGVNENLLSSH